MVKISIPNIYSTLYTKCDNNYCVQKEIRIPGETGKHIQINELSLSLCVASDGATATAWVATDIAGVPAIIATWTETETKFQPVRATPGFIAEVGKDVTLRWNLKTSDSMSRAKMTDLTYTYSIMDSLPIDAKCLVVIKCETQEEAMAVAASLTNKGADVYTREV